MSKQRKAPKTPIWREPQTNAEGGPNQTRGNNKGNKGPPPKTQKQFRRMCQLFTTDRADGILRKCIPVLFWTSKFQTEQALQQSVTSSTTGAGPNDLGADAG